MFSNTVSLLILRSADKKARNGGLPIRKKKYSTEYKWNAENFGDVSFCSESDLEGYSVKLKINHLN